MFSSRTKTDLIIEVWEHLDCESVGAKEILAIEAAVRERFGDAAVDSPMKLARLLADEGAELRHPEIMQLFVERCADRPYEASFRNILRLDDLRSAGSSLRRLDTLRQKFSADADKDGLRLLREKVIAARAALAEKASSKTSGERLTAAEISEWLALWLKTPEMFAQWLDLRKRSKDFRAKFSSDDKQ